MASTTTKTAGRPRVIKIERNIPIPKYTKMPSTDNLAEDLKNMKPEESRLIDLDYTPDNLNAMRTRIHGMKKRLELTDRKYTVNLDPKTEKKMRVWRLV